MESPNTIRWTNPRPSWRSWLDKIFQYGMLLLFALYVLAPFFFVIATAFKTPGELQFNPLGLPTTLHWENFREAWEVGRFGRYFLNSVIVSVPIVLGTVSLSSLAGYGLARLKLPGGNFVFYFFLIGLMVPLTAIMIPLFYVLRDIGFLGTYWAMIAPQIALGLPFGIFFMRAFFRGLPYDLADAAKIDGCNDFGVFWRVMLPLAGPASTALSIFIFMGAWNAYLLPLLYMQSDSLRPLMVGMMFFTTRRTIDFTLTMAGTLIIMFPILVVYMLFQRQFVKGLTAGAVKG